MISYSPLSCHFGRPSPAFPEIRVPWGKREGRQAGKRRILDAFESGDARLPEQSRRPGPACTPVDRYSPYMRLKRTSCTIDDPKFDVSASAMLKAGPQASVTECRPRTRPLFGAEMSLIG